MLIKKTGRLMIIFMAIVMLLMVVTASLQAAPATPPGQEKEDVLIGFYGKPNRDLINRSGGEVAREFTIVNVIAAKLPQQAIDALSRNPLVRYIEPDSEVMSIAQDVPWGINRVFGPEAYSFPSWQHPVEHSIKVAVLDTGIDRFHEDLPTILGGTNTIDSTHWGSDGYGHGTHVAGIIAALDNSRGVVGVTPGIGLYSVKVMDDSGLGTVSSVVAGIEWANDQNIPVINMSLGLNTHNKTLQDAVDNAYANGMIMVAAVGNTSGGSVFYPAAYSSVIAVSASDSSDRLATFSSIGPEVELIAPGVSIRSTYPGNRYASLNGTSMASPHVAGAAALTWSVNSSLTNTEVRQILRQSAQDLNLLPEHQGYGLVRVDLATAEAAPKPNTTGYPGVINLVASFNSGTWYWDDNAWAKDKISSSTATALAGDGEVIYATFSSGTWKWGGFNWERLSPSAARALAMADVTGDGNLNLVASFTSGTWYWDNGWAGRISSSSATALAGDGDVLYATFASGTWKWDDGWVSPRLSPSRATALAMADVTGDGNLNLVASFTSGTWYWDNGWAGRISSSPARALAGDGDVLYASFGSGTWIYWDDQWSSPRLSSSTAHALAAADFNQPNSPDVYTVTFVEVNGLAGASIQVFSDPGQTVAVGGAVTTDSTGKAAKDLEDGSYWFTASRSDYEDYPGDFLIDGSNEMVYFEMFPEDPDGVFILHNPYKNVNWDTAYQYKANFHTHTSESDGVHDPEYVIDEYYEAGYKILALTDHDTQGPGGTLPANIETTWPWTDWGRNPGALGILAVEGNEISAPHHHLSLFNGWGAESTSIENSLWQIDDRDGLAILSHPGRYTEPLYDDYTYQPYPAPLEDSWYVNLYQTYHNAHLVGIEVYTFGDGYPYDRELWDRLNAILMPDITVFGYSVDDMHHESQMFRNYQFMLMENLTESALKEAMLTGASYFCYEPGGSGAVNPPVPRINKIAVTSGGTVITITAANYDSITWRSDKGVVGSGSNLDLKTLGLDGDKFIRAELVNSNGKTYTQPFVLQY